MTTTALTSNGAVRLGAVLLGGVLIYWLWSASSSSKTLPKDRKASEEEKKVNDASKDSTSRTGSFVKQTTTTATTTTTTVRKTAAESGADNETVEENLTKAIKITESIDAQVEDRSQESVSELTSEAAEAPAEVVIEPNVEATADIPGQPAQLAESVKAAEPVESAESAESAESVEPADGHNDTVVEKILDRETEAVVEVTVETVATSAIAFVSESMDSSMEMDTNDHAFIDDNAASTTELSGSEPEQNQQRVTEQKDAEEEQEEEAVPEETDAEEVFELVFEREVPREATAKVAQIHEPELERNENVQFTEGLSMNGHAALEVDAETPTTLVGEDMDLSKDTLINTESVARQVQTLQEISRVAQHSELNAKAPEFKPSWMPGSTSVPSKTQAPVPRGPAATQEQVKMKSRCRFWPNCTNKSCKFTHPSSPCRDPENCTFGDRCIFIHPSDLKPRPPRENKGSKKLQPTGPVKKKRPQSSDSSATMVSVTPEGAWSSSMK